MTLSLIICKDKEKWDQFVNTSPQGNVFCTTPFLDSLNDEYDVLLVEENGSPQIGTVVIKNNDQPIRAPYPYAMYQGILVNPTISSCQTHSRIRRELETMEYLLSEMEKRYDRISFFLHRSYEDLRSILWFHYHEPDKGVFDIQLRYTGILDLNTISNFDNYIASIRKVRRYEYRQAVSKGLTIETSDDVEILNHLHKCTFERQGIIRSVREEKLLLAISTAAVTEKFGTILICRNNEGIPISATLFVYDEKCGYFIFAANDPEYRNSFGGTYLLLENIRQFKEMGLNCVDFGGINSPNRGDFKTSFNARPVPFYLTTWEKPKI